MIDPKRFWLHFGAFSLVGISALVFMASGSLYAWAIIPVFSGLAILLGKPSALLWWGLGWFMWTQYIQRELWVGFFNYLDEFVTICMLAVLFVHSRQVNKFITVRMNMVQPYQKITFSFVLLAAVSAILNRAIDIYFVMWCFQYLRMFIVFFFAVRFIKERDVPSFIRFLMAFAMLQFLLNIGWRLHINPLPNEKEYWPSDFAVGTFAACDQVAYFCIMMIILCLAIITDPPDIKTKKYAWITLIFTLINLVITNTNHAYFILLGAVTTFLVLHYRAVRRVFNVPALAGMGLILVVGYSVALSYSDAASALSGESLSKRYNKLMYGAKMVTYKRNFTELPKESSFFWLTGHGPGQAGSSIGRALQRPIADKYFNVLKQSLGLEYRIERAAGSILSGEQTGFLTYWSELGPLGLLILFISYLALVIKSQRRIRSNDIANKYQLALARAMPSVVVTVMLVSFLRDMFYIAWLVGVVWVWAAFALVPLEHEAKKTGMEII